MKLFKYSYQAKNKQGTSYVFANNINEAMQKIHNKSLLPTSVIEVHFFLHLGGKTQELENIFWQLGFSYGSGLDLIIILESIKEELRHQEHIVLLQSMINALQGGDLLSKALKEHRQVCGNFIVALFEIGEKSGYLQETCELCARELAYKNEFFESLYKALLYPFILALTFLGVFFTLLFFVIPEFVQIYNDLGATLPFSTQCILWVSVFFQSYFLEFLFCFCAFAILCIFIFRQKHLRDKIFFSLPFVGNIILDYELSVYFLALHYFLKSQVPFEESVEKSYELIDNIEIKKRLMSIADYLHQGIPLSKALEDIDCTIANIALLRSGEKSGMFDKALELNANFYKKRFKQSLQTIQILTQPVATIIMGICVAFLAFSIVAPMWQLLEVAL